jgi:hypothetical protein
MAMRTSRLAWRLIGLSGLAGASALIISAGGLTAAASGSSGWRIVSTIGSDSSKIGNGDLVVTGPASAWASWTCGPCPSGSKPDQNLMQQWNGKSWNQVELPADASYPTAIEGMQASSASNLWLFTNKRQAVVFNGSRWSVKDLPDWVIRPIEGDAASVASAVFSASDVWAFSIDAAREPTLAGHFAGGSWHQVFLPIIPGTAVGLGPDDIWLYGFAKNFGSRMLAHWNGKSWSTLSFPQVAKGATLVTSSLARRQVGLDAWRGVRP